MFLALIQVLIFSQMTKMLNLLEDYCRYRRYRFLRLDGSSTITDRREMVDQFQGAGPPPGSCATVWDLAGSCGTYGTFLNLL